MSNPSRRAVMLSGAAASLAAGTLAAEASPIIAVGLNPYPIFDETAFYAKLDELGPEWLLDVAADILESADDDASGEGLNTRSYRKKMAERDRRQRLLRLTAKGEALEVQLFDALRERMSAAYSSAGQGAVGGFWAVLEGLVPEDERGKVAGLRG